MYKDALLTVLETQTISGLSNLFFNPFLPSIMRVWNDLPDNVKESNTVSSFKCRLNRDLKAPPKYFNAGSRIGQILRANFSWNAAHTTRIFSVKTSYLVRRVLAVNSKVHSFFSTHALSIQTSETDTCLVYYQHTIFTTYYLEKNTPYNENEFFIYFFFFFIFFFFFEVQFT